MMVVAVYVGERSQVSAWSRLRTSCKRRGGCFTVATSIPNRCYVIALPSGKCACQPERQCLQYTHPAMNRSLLDISKVSPGKFDIPPVAARRSRRPEDRGPSRPDSMPTLSFSSTSGPNETMANVVAAPGLNSARESYWPTVILLSLDILAPAPCWTETLYAPVDCTVLLPVPSGSPLASQIFIEHAIARPTH